MQALIPLMALTNILETTEDQISWLRLPVQDRQGSDHNYWSWPQLLPNSQDQEMKKEDE